MRLVFIVNPVQINDGWSPWDARVGGSEECVIEWSKRLQAKGYECSVFHNGQHGDFQGVNYLPHNAYEPADVTINVNYPQFFPQGKTIYWTSLTENPNLDEFDAVCAISDYARKHTGLPKRTKLVPPGYDPKQIYPGHKFPKQCLYASSPDRGLDTLLQAWPSVVAAHPDATLVLTYGAPQVNLPNIINLGTVDESTMDELYRTSDIWCHPANGGELYCMTGIKAQAAGCVPVYIPTMALAETVRYGYKATDQNYATMLITALSDTEGRARIRRLLAKESYPTWEDSVNSLLDVINSVI